MTPLLALILASQLSLAPSLLPAPPRAPLRKRFLARSRDREGESAVGLLLEKTLDTLDDLAVILRRTLPLSARPSPRGRPRVLVLGSGWSAHALLKVVDTSRFEVICLSPRPFFVFTPMLASTAVGTVEYRSIVENIRAANPTVDFLEGEATSVDVEGRQVRASVDLGKTARRNLTLGYDILVFAVGARVADFGVPGVREHCCFIKEVEDVRRIKQQIFRAFETASLVRPSRVNPFHFKILAGDPRRRDHSTPSVRRRRRRPHRSRVQR